MNTWKPKGWDGSRDVMAKECADDERFKGSDIETLIKAMFDAGAECMLEKVYREIEKVENLYSAQGRPRCYRVGFEGCRKKILSLLKE